MEVLYIYIGSGVVVCVRVRTRIVPPHCVYIVHCFFCVCVCVCVCIYHNVVYTVCIYIYIYISQYILYIILYYI